MTAGLNVRRNVSTTVAAFFVNIALTFVGYRLVVQQGGTAALGLWASLSAAIYVIRLGDVGMGSAAERHIAGTNAAAEPERARSYLDTALLLNGGLFLVLAAIGWGLFTWRIDWVVPGDAAAKAEAMTILPLMLAGFVVSNLANVVTGGLRGLHLGYLAAYLSIVGGLVQMSVVLALVPTMGVAGLAWGQLAQNLVMGLVAWFLFNRYLGRLAGVRQSQLPKAVSRTHLHELFGFSLKAQAVNLTNGLFEPASKLLVGHFGGLSVLGLYEMAYKIVALPRNAVVSGVHGSTPAMTRLLTSNLVEARKLYLRSRRLVTLASGAVLAAVVAGSPIASYALLGQVDKMLVGFTAVIAAGFFGNALGAPAYTLGFSAGRLSGNMISAVLSLAMLVVGSWIGQHFWPVWGSIVAASVGLATGGIIIRVINERLLNVGRACQIE